MMKKIRGWDWLLVGKMALLAAGLVSAITLVEFWALPLPHNPALSAIYTVCNILCIQLIRFPMRYMLDDHYRMHPERLSK